MKKYELAYLDEHDVIFLKMLDNLEPDEVRNLMKVMGADFKKTNCRRILCDISHSGVSISKEARRAFRETSGLVDYEKIAMIGGTPPMRMMAKVILAITGTSDKTKFFKVKEEALTWLKG